MLYLQTYVQAGLNALTCFSAQNIIEFDEYRILLQGCAIQPDEFYFVTR